MILLLAAALAVMPQDTVRLSFPEAVRHARATNPNFVRERLQFENSEISLDGSWADRYLPEVSLGFTIPEYVAAVGAAGFDDSTGRQLFRFTESQRISTALEVSQPLITGGTLRVTGTLNAMKHPKDPIEARFSSQSFLGFELSQQVFGINNSIRQWRLAKESFARAEAEFANEERNLARSVMDAYYGLVQARKQAQIDSVLFVRDSIRNAAAGSSTGERASEVDSLKFELEAARSAFNRTRSFQSLARARSRLNEVLALPPHTVVVTDTAITVERLVPDIDAGLAAAYANRQDLRLAQLGVENRRAGLRDAHRTSPVTLFIRSRIGFDGNSGPFPDNSRPLIALENALATQLRSNRISMGVNVPIFDRFDEQHAVARSSNDLRSAEITLADQTRRLENEVRNAAQRLQNASTGLDLAERQFSITRRTLEIQTPRFARGEITSVEFLIDQASARQAEIGLLTAQVEMLTATEEWRRATGDRSGLAVPGSAPSS